MSVTDIKHITNYLRKETRNGVAFDNVKRKYIQEFSPTAEEVLVINEQFELAKKDVKSFELVQSILTKELLYDEEDRVYRILTRRTKHLEKIDAATLRLLFNPKVLTSTIHNLTHFCKMGYNPNSEALFYKEENSNFTQVNLYRPADWQIDYFFSGAPVPKVDLPAVYDEYLEHLTGGSALSKKYLLNFMASCVQTNKKAYTYCTLLGAQGVGKGVLFNIIKQLVGEENASEIRANKLSEVRFNGFAKNKKVLFFDELDIRNSADETALKFYVNPVLEIEEKGKDSKQYTNYANIIIASNSLSNLRIENDDRRYSFVDLGYKKLEVLAKEKYGMDVIDYVTSKLLNETNIKQLGEYLLNYVIDDDLLNTVLKSEAKKNQKLHSLKDWEVAIFRELAPRFAGKELTLTEAKLHLQELTDNSKVNPGRDTWKTLQDKVPGFFKRVKKRMDDGSQVYMLKFEELDKQPKHIASENED